MTSHNRVTKTIACLERLIDSGDSASVALTAFIADAASTDGTREACELFGERVQVLRVPSTVYWAQGTRIACESARKGDPSHYLLLNDDTNLLKSAISELLKGFVEVDADVVVGATVDPATGERTYGGYRKEGKRLDPLPITDGWQRCDTFNGNIVMLSARAYTLTGGVDPIFVHGLGDFDLGFRSVASGLKVFQAPGIQGLCCRDAPRPLRGTPLRALKRAVHPKKSPVRPWFIYCRRHARPFYLKTFLGPYLRALLTGK